MVECGEERQLEGLECVLRTLSTNRESKQYTSLWYDCAEPHRQTFPSF